MDPLDDQQADAGTGTEEVDQYAFLDNISDPEPEQEPTTEVEGQPTLEEGDNPKWAKFLADVPTAFIPMMKEKLKELDRETNEGFRKKAEEWAPYKPFREKNIDPDVLQKAYDFAQYTAQNPVEIYAQLHERLTADPNYRQILEQRGLLQAVAAAKADAEENGEPDPFAAEDPNEAIKALRAEIAQRDQQMLQIYQQQQEEAQQAQWQQEEAQNIETSFANIETRTGRLPDSVKSQIIEKAIMMGQARNGPVSIEEAAVQVFRFMQEARPKRSAPRTIPGGGNIPQPQGVDPSEMSKDDRVEAVRRIAAQLADKD